MAVSYSGLHPKLRNLVRNLPRFASIYGLSYRVTSAYRSPYKQAQLYKAYLEGRSPYPVAPPGTSAHEKGLAIDVVAADQNEMARLLTAAGLFWGGSSDPVHFQLNAPKSKQSAYIEWAEGPGSLIPPVLTKLPVVGLGFSVAKDPWKVVKQGVNKMLDVVFGFL